MGNSEARTEEENASPASRCAGLRSTAPNAGLDGTAHEIGGLREDSEDSLGWAGVWALGGHSLAQEPSA